MNPPAPVTSADDIRLWTTGSSPRMRSTIARGGRDHFRFLPAPLSTVQRAKYAFVMGDGGQGAREEAARIRAVYEQRRRAIPWARYSLSDPGALFLYQQRTRDVVRLLVRAGYFPLDGARILDVGCGGGGWLVDFESWGARQDNLAGIDVDRSRLARARERLPAADLREGDGEVLPWPAGSFDLVVQSMAFTSILRTELRVALAAEMTRVVRPSGAILWYDFFRANPRNPDVRAIGGTEVRRLFPGFDLTLKRVTLAPPLARRLAGRAWVVALLLESGRLLNTHHLGLLRPPRAGAPG